MADILHPALGVGTEGPGQVDAWVRMETLKGSRTGQREGGGSTEPRFFH